MVARQGGGRGRGQAGSWASWWRAWGAWVEDGGARWWSRDKAWWRARIVGEVDGLGGIAVKGRGEKLFRLVQYCSLEVVGIFFLD